MDEWESKRLWLIPQRRYEYKRRERGLCIRCDSPRVTMNHCEFHRQKINEQISKRKREKCSQQSH